MSSNTLRIDSALHLSSLGIYIHAITVAIVIGFSIALVVIEYLGIKRKDKDYINLAKQISLFIVIAFVFGAATGTLVEFGLIQVWNGVILAIGSFVFLPLYLELIAFIIETSLLAALVYTWDKFKNPWTHWSITVVYAFGALFSGALITAVNSWMQAPWGVGDLVKSIYPWAPVYGPTLSNTEFLVELKKALIEVGSKGDYGSSLITPTMIEQLVNRYGILLKDPWVSLASPVAMVSIIHQLLASIAVGVFWIAGALSYKALKSSQDSEKREKYFKLFKIVALMGSIIFLIQGIEGHEQGVMVYLYQPTKFAMIAGLERSGAYPPAGLTIVGDPNHQFKGFDHLLAASENHPNPHITLAGVSLKEIAVTDTLKALKKLPLVKSLYEVKIMLAGLGVIISFIIISTLIFRRFWKKREREKILLYGGLVMFFITPAIAGLGWAVREIGRKPWTVYGLLYPEELITLNPINIWVAMAILLGIVIGLVLTFWTAYKVMKNPPRFLIKVEE
ncbi:MAG: cytochrome ubiquinol oxidase subunit I [Nitrososphaerota archaeon]|nr:cytochrome ubiquinol oxidase subunit I [Nitrososphaerota archaeon]